MPRLNVAVIYGGANTEHEVSKASAATIIANLSTEKYNVIPIYITPSGRWLLNDSHTNDLDCCNLEKFGQTTILSPDSSAQTLLRITTNKAREIPIDVVFPVLHGRLGEDGTIQGLCELSGIPYVGSGVLASAVSMDKFTAKTIAAYLNIPCPPYLAYKLHELSDKASLDEAAKAVRQILGYPCFVKPSNSGSSIGISKARNKTQLIKAIHSAFEHDNKILIEKAIIGRELECSVLGSNASDAFVSIVGEIIPGEEFYTYDAKYNNSTSQTVAPADIPAEISDKIRTYALQIFEGVDAYGMARVDFFWDEAANAVYFNEINTIPGFTSISMYPTMLNASGLSTPQIVDTLIELALER